MQRKHKENSLIRVKKRNVFFLFTPNNKREKVAETATLMAIIISTVKGLRYVNVDTLFAGKKNTLRSLQTRFLLRLVCKENSIVDQ